MRLADLSDEELLGEFQRRPAVSRAEAADELFSRHYALVARWCYRFTGSRDAAGDLAQDVFLKAHRHLGTFRGDSRFTTWLYTIVRHEAMNRYQRTMPAAEDTEVLAEVAAAAELPDAAVERSDRAARVRGFLCEQLEDVERTVFTLHYGDEMPLEAITRVLRLTNASGAKAYIVSARRKLSRATARLKARGQTL